MAKKTTSLAGKRSPNAGSFKKGDPRINRNGPISTGVLAFNRSLRELIVAEGEAKHTALVGEDGTKVTLKKVEWMVKVAWNAAMKGEPWAVQFIAEKVEGKVTQPIGFQGEDGTTGNVLFVKVVQVKDQNGNGNTR